MKELGRDLGELSSNYACDCCGMWMSKGSHAVYIGYEHPWGDSELDQIARSIKGTGRKLSFKICCLDCVE